MSPIIKPRPLVYRGAKDIAAAAGIDHKRICHYVHELGLPAFKIEFGSKTWLATHEDLMRWIEHRKQWYFAKNKNLGGDGT